MRKISYCTTCKGRLWQLEQTLPVNILLTNECIEIIILDYHSDDGLESYVKDNYKEYLEDGRLKYYKLVTEVAGFDMAYAKHIVHMLAKGDVLFNLDADNYIGVVTSELETLDNNSLLVSNKIKGTATSRGGRIGITKESYRRIGGYNPRVLGMIGDDGVFINRALKMGLKLIYTADKSIPIQQEESYKNIHVIEREKEFRHHLDIVIANHNDVEETIHLWLRGTPV